MLIGDNTDFIGIIRVLRNVGLQNLRTAVVIGAGGTACSAIFALKQLNAERIFVYNRTAKHGCELSSRFGCSFADSFQHMEEVIDVVSHSVNWTYFSKRRTDDLIC